MRRQDRTLATIVIVAVALSCASCGGGKRFYPVTGRVMVNGKPGEGVTVVFHPQEQTEPPLLPSAVVAADGTFTLQSWIVDDRELKQGAPAGSYKITCVWYPPDLEKYLGGAAPLPDRLHGKYADKDSSGLSATIAETSTDLPPFELQAKQ